MYIAMNRFTVAKGQEHIFEDSWLNRNSYLREVPGFKAFHLLKGASDERGTVYISHSRWESEESFIGWTKSEAFKLAHQNARMPEGVLLGPPRFEGYRSIGAIIADS